MQIPESDWQPSGYMWLLKLVFDLIIAGDTMQNLKFPLLSGSQPVDGNMVQLQALLAFL